MFHGWLVAPGPAGGEKTRGCHLILKSLDMETWNVLMMLLSSSDRTYCGSRGYRDGHEERTARHAGEALVCTFAGFLYDTSHAFMLATLYHELENSNNVLTMRNGVDSSALGFRSRIADDAHGSLSINAGMIPRAWKGSGTPEHG